MDLEALAPIIADIVKDSLNKKVYYYGRFQRGPGNRIGKGTLRDSIGAVVEDNKQGIQVVRVTALGGKRLEDTYAYWLINNRNPGASPKGGNFRESIEDWIMNKKSFIIKDFKTGQTLPKTEKNVKQVAYVVARSIARFGFQNVPKNFIEVSIDTIMKDPRITQIIEDATYDDLLKKIEGI
jgi:hypothetical protein